MGWEVKKRQRYALIEQDSEDPRKHRGTFYIGPRHVTHHSTKEFVELNYVTAPNFASEKDCRVFAQNSHVAIEVYDYYTKLFDPDYESVSVYDERFIVQYEFKTGKWRDVDAYNPIIQVIPLEDGIEIKRMFDTDYGEKSLKISYIVRTGALLKHDVVFTNLTANEKNFRVIMKLAGITHSKVRHKAGELHVIEKTSIGKQPFFFIGEDDKHLKLTEYLWSLGEDDEETGGWNPTALKDVVFDVHAHGCKADIVIGNYTLGLNESLLIDPDSDTWQVGAGNDDAIEYGSGGFNKADSYNRVHSYNNTSSSNYICCGVRFTSVNIGQGDTIDSADVKLYTYSTSYDDMNSLIYGNDVDNAQDFNDNAHIISEEHRPRTSASVSWVEYSLGIGWQTKSVTSVIQEIVNREGWSSSNALVLLFIANTDVDKHFRAKAYETSTTQCPKLEVEWTSGGAPETYTKTWQTNALFEKLGITKTLPIDATFKNLDILKTYVVDALFGKTFEKIINLDVALRRLNIPKQWLTSVAFQKAVLETFLLDVTLKKKDVKIQKQLNVLFKKLDLLKQFGVDVDFLKKDIVKSFAIDTYFGLAVTHIVEKQIDVLLRKTVITQRQVDALFRKTLPICADVTVVFKKLDILKTFGVDTALLKNNVMKSFAVDAWFGTVCAVTYSKNFGLDVVFRYKVKFPTPLGITLDGQLVIPLKKEVWVES